MNIGIFSKFEMVGGSELRCIELCNGIVSYTSHDCFLLAEKEVSPSLHKLLSPKVKIICNALESPQYIYDIDHLLIVNTDSKEFSTVDYWQGKSHRHNKNISLDKLKDKHLYFLYNFIVSPSQHLREFIPFGINVNIITTNNKFYNEITKQDRYESVRIFPRYILESPINPKNLNTLKRSFKKGKICFGMHSKRLNNKWNNDIHKLIIKLNERYTNDKIEFRFMGIKKDLAKKLSEIENVVCFEENKHPVSYFLESLDVFMFFPEWNREEPWARVIAEAMVSGCPIIALDKGGTKDQVLHWHNGILCKRYDDYYKAIIYFIEHPEIISQMSKNSIRISKNFFTEKVINKLMNIMKI
jgi:glycosyltransferase involved in cell wall biosynthesis